MAAITRNIPVVKAKLVDANGQEAPFCLMFYGIPIDEFLVSPGGGEPIRRALERRGLADKYVSSPFMIFQQRYGYLGRN